MANTSKDGRLIAIAKTMKNIPWCEDYEKMISGMLYDSMVPELKDGRQRARRLMHKFNTYFNHEATMEELEAERFVMLSELLGGIGKNSFVEPPFYVDYGSNITFGEMVVANYGFTILDCSLVQIGHRVMFGPHVSIFGATHETEVQSRRDFIEFAREVTIGNDCWIGGHTVILPGVHIGEGCTIGAGSVVSRSIPAWSVAMGSPARVVRKVTELPPMKPDSPEASTAAEGTSPAFEHNTGFEGK